MSQYTNRLTLHTLKWIFYRKHDPRFEMCETPAQMQGLTYKILNLRPGEDKSFDKGNRMIDYTALFNWFKDYKTNRDEEAGNKPLPMA